MTKIPKLKEQYTRPEPVNQAEKHFRKAWQFRKDRNYEEAVQEFLKSLKSDPDKPATHFNLALVLDCLEEGERACSHAFQSLQLFEKQKDISKVSTAFKLVRKLQKKYGETEIK